MYQFSFNLSLLQQKFSLTSNYLGTNTVVVKRVDCSVLFSVNLVAQFLQVYSRKITHTEIKGEQAFLHETHHLDLIYKPTKYMYHQNI